MKPLLIFKFEESDYEPDRAKDFDEYIRSTELPKTYDILVVWGNANIKVYYPFNFFSFYYQKLKAWLILKIWKKNIS